MKNNSIYDDVIDIIDEKDFVLINIKEDCSLDYFINQKDRYKNKEMNIPTRLFILNNNLQLEKQKIYYFEKKNSKYIIFISNKKIIISEMKTKDELVYETEVDIKELQEFSVAKYIHDSNNGTKECRVYNSNNNNKTLIEELSLNKKEALSLAQDLFDNIKFVGGFYKIMNVYPLYRRLNLVPDTWYNPIVSDDVITLSSSRFSSIDSVNRNKNATLDIILNETKEQVGTITFNFKNTGFTYDGNIGYEIKDEFQHNGYASRALKLIKEVIKSNQFKGDKDIYISTVPNNIYSQKVAENNEGKLVYNGNVPDNDKYNYKYGVKEVKVYQIKMNNQLQIS